MTALRPRRSLLLVSALGLAAACGGDGIVLPDESRPASIVIVSGNDQSASAGATLGLPLVVKVNDGLGRPVEGQAIAFTIQSGGGQVTPATASTGADGQVGAAWTLGNAAGQQLVQAQVSGNDLHVEFKASAKSGEGTVLELVSGDNQRAAVGSALPDSLVVRVTDQLGNPVAGVEVQWTAAGGGSVSPASVLTLADGTAAAERVLGNASGTQTATATAGGIAPVTFTQTAEPANPTSLIKISGDGQTGLVSSPLGDSLVVRLVDDNGNGVGGKAITWVIGVGGGVVKPTTVITNPNGFARTEWTLGANPVANSLSAVFSGVPPVPFTAMASAANAAPTAVADGYAVNEDGSLTVNAASGVLNNDSDPDSDPLTAVLDAGPAHAQSFSLNADGSFTYVPNADFNGDDSFTYHANDGPANSATVTVTLTVAPVNDAPSFVSGGDVTVNAGDGDHSQAWATGGSPGPADESGQDLTYSATVSFFDSFLFSAGPTIDPDGTLHFTPSGLTGTATVTVHVQDDGGTANGGVDTSPEQTFTITIN